MALIVSMLRGVNFGGHNKIKMDALRALCESLKLRDAQTYVQSGNAILRTDERDIARLAKRIEDGIEKKFGFRPDVILRTAEEMREVIARNPFAKRRGIEPSKLWLVKFSETRLNKNCGGALQKSFLPQVEGGFGEIGGAAEVAPIVVVGAKGEDFFSVSGETQIGGDDGENAFFNHYGKKTRRNNVDAGKSQRLHLL